MPLNNSAAVLGMKITRLLPSASRIERRISTFKISLLPFSITNNLVAASSSCPVIFTPHLGNFKRGILATITVKVKPEVDLEAVKNAYQVYDDKPMVRMREPQWPKIDQVAGTPFCDIGWKLDPDSGHLVVVSAIDNLLKGAAAQGLQCIMIHFGLEA